LGNALPAAAEADLRVAVAGPTRWAGEGVAAALRALHRQADVRSFDGTAPLLAASRWPDLAVALVGTEAQQQAIELALPASLPVLWLVEPGAAGTLPRPARTRPTAWLHADSAPDRWQAALTALLAGLSVHEPDLAPTAARRGADLMQAQDPLTPRELEVLELMAKGLANRDIALALGMSPHTAKFHVAQILDKTGAASRTEAVSQGLRHGLIGL
jgi:DNA-binding NarL/FixJ family response regulator